MVFAQGKPEAKLKKLWDKDPRKCVAKAEKYINKNRALPASYYYLTLYRVEKARTKQKASYFKRALRSYNDALEHTSPALLELGNQLDTAINNWAKNASFTELKIVHHSYYEIYQDSLDAYQLFITSTVRDSIEHEHINSLLGLDSLRKALLSAAAKLEGVPYKWAGEDTNGFDCSGFTKYVYGTIGINLPHNAQKQALLKLGEEQTFEETKPGDLVFFGSRNGEQVRVVHAAILFEKEPDSVKVIHCVSGGVSIDGENSSWEYHWKDRVLFSRSILSANE
jgi:cell wall-associated NlpC family hydrolase